MKLYEDPHFTFRFADGRLIPRFHLEGVEALVRRSLCGLARRSLSWRDRKATQWSEDSMIFRLSDKLKTKIKAGVLGALPLHENPLTDWSAHLFVVGRTQYILLSNTKSLYSVVMSGKGITDDSKFIDRALSGIRECLEAVGQGGVHERIIAPAGASVRFAKALDRSVTGSMNDLVKHAAFWLAEGELSPQDVGARLHGIPMSALKTADSGYGFPRDVFAAMAGAAGA